VIRRRDENRGPWYLLTGLVLGLAVGLLISWVLSPVKYVDTAPFSLRGDYKDVYRGLIAAAYQADGDLGRARSRLALLGDADPARALVDQAQESMVDGKAGEEARSLAGLAAAMGGNPNQIAALRLSPSPATPTPAVLTPTLVPSSPTLSPTVTPGPTLTATVSTADALLSATPRPSATRAPTDTPQPSRTPTLTPGPPFVVADQKKLCDPSLNVSILQVQVNDAAGKPVPGVQVIVTWNGGQDTFFTGLKPDVNPGFADFTMTVGTVYTLRLADGGEPINDLTAPLCAGSNRPGGWLVTFKQP